MKKSWFMNKKLLVILGVFILILFLILFKSIKTNFLIKFIEFGLGIYLGIKFYKIYKMSKSENLIKAVGIVTLDSLIRSHFITTFKSKIKLHVKNEDGVISCYITGVTQSESNLFTSSVEEVFSKAVNQRYIIARLSNNLKELNDY